MTTRSRLRITQALYDHLFGELAVRGAGIRESGAFLLAQVDSLTAEDGQHSDQVFDQHWTDVLAVAFYDDLDATCLTGGIDFAADGYTALALICEQNGVQVVGDVHTHPSTWVQQSCIDSANPMCAIPGHVAFIAPRYAQGEVRPEDLGAHVFLGSRRWDSFYGSDAAKLLQIVVDTPALPDESRPPGLLHRLRALWTSRSRRRR